MADRGSTPSNAPSLADQGVGTTQVIDLADIDLSGLDDERKLTPPPLPPEELARASQLPSAPPASQLPNAPLAPSVPPAEAPRSTRFYLVVLAACLFAFVAAGALIARSMRGAPLPAPAALAPPPAGASAKPAAASAKPAGPRVITISPVEMTDDVDTAKKK